MKADTAASPTRSGQTIHWCPVTADLSLRQVFWDRAACVACCCSLSRRLGLWTFSASTALGFSLCSPPHSACVTRSRARKQELGSGSWT